MSRGSAHKRFKAGDVIDDRYEVIEVLGRGGYGVVLSARQLSTEQLVAIKVLLINALNPDSESEIKRFEREMKLIGKLKHPNIVKLLDFGSLRTGERYTVLELVDGRSLHDVLVDEGALEAEEAKHLMFQILEGLSVAHEQGIVHRDLKPANIMVTSSGFRRNALILDFGIADVVEDARDDDYLALTGANKVKGTAAYMAPEQAKKSPSTPQSDIYAWGLVYMECLTGERVMTGQSSFDILLAQAKPEPVPIPNSIGPPALRGLLERAVAKPLEERYQNATEILRELHAISVENSDLALLETGAHMPLDATADFPATIEASHDIDEPTPEAVSPPPSSSNTRTFLLIGLVLILLAAAALLMLPRDTVETSEPPPAAQNPTTAPPATTPDTAQAAAPDTAPPAPARVENPVLLVLPFANLSSSEEDAYFSDGLTEELILVLGRTDELRVLPRTTAFNLRGTQRKLDELGRELGVSHILEGSVRRSKDTLRVSISLISVDTGMAAFSESFDRPFTDVFAVQEAIAKAVSDALRVELIVKPKATERVEAFNHYLKGRFYWAKRSKTTAQKAIDNFNQALAIDPDYSVAHAALADVFTIQAWYGWTPAPEGYAKARDAAQRAIELDSSLIEVHAVLGHLAAYIEHDWDASQEHFQRCLVKEPRYATCYQWYASVYLFTQKRFDEGRKTVKTARRLDPYAPIMLYEMAESHFYQGDYDKALEVLDEALEMHPEFFMLHYERGRILTQTEQHEDALEALRTAHTLSGEETMTRAMLGYAQARAGQPEAARQHLQGFLQSQEAQHIPADHLALLHIGLGEHDDAFALLEQAVREHATGPLYLDLDPAYAPLREDPRFDALLKQLNLSP